MGAEDAIVHALTQVTQHEYLPGLHLPATVTLGDSWAEAVVIKDAGDDPDVTDGAQIARLVEASGLELQRTGSICDEVWLKLWGNLSFNPVAALTGYLMNQICADEAVLDVIRALMREGMAVSAHYGYPMPMTPDQRIDLARQLGAAKISRTGPCSTNRPCCITLTRSHRSATTQCRHFGFRASQTCRPWWIIQWLNIAQSDGGSWPHRSASTFTGSS